MGQVTVRRLDDEVIARHKERARAKGISLEQELRNLLTEGSRLSRAEIVEQYRQIRNRNQPGNWPDSTALLREDRESH